MFELHSRKALLPLVVFKGLSCIFFGNKVFKACSEMVEIRRKMEAGSERETLVRN